MDREAQLSGQPTPEAFDLRRGEIAAERLRQGARPRCVNIAESLVRRGKIVEEISSSTMTPQQIEQLYVHHLRDVA
jgi:hypothetical protein